MPGKVLRDAIASCIAANQRMPASPAFLDVSQSSTDSASCSNVSVVSTRKGVFMADLVQKFVRRVYAPGLHVFISLTDALNGFLRVRALPFEVRSQSFVERVDGILAVALRVVFQLRFEFRRNGNEFHA